MCIEGNTKNKRSEEQKEIQLMLIDFCMQEEILFPLSLTVLQQQLKLDIKELKEKEIKY